VTLIWATRGRSWGFRFLLKGGYPDPLPTYERAFIGMQGEHEACQRVGEHVALRFPDPRKRKDAAGRIIPHDFVVMGPLADEINSVDDGIQRIWPRVAHIYAEAWGSVPPSASAVQTAIDGLSTDTLDTGGEVETL